MGEKPARGDPHLRGRRGRETRAERAILIPYSAFRIPDSTTMSNPVSIPRNLLFRCKFGCPRLKAEPKGFAQFDPAGEVPLLGLFEGQHPYARLRCGWMDEAFFLGLSVRGKTQSLWVKPSQPLESDGMQFWIDTRDTHNVHRATRYCHWFVACPSPVGGRESASCGMLRINRAKEDAPTINRGKVVSSGSLVAGGYDLMLKIPASLLNGWSPQEQRLIGFSAAVIDRELGWNTLGVGSDLPLAEDPSLWSTLELLG